VKSLSPTLEGFRAALRRPSLTFAEVMWRWVVGATAIALFFFGLFEYMGTLPVTNGELLFLRTRHPFLVAQAIAHIFRGSLGRAVISMMLAVVMMTMLWIVVASLGRMATLRALVDYFRKDDASGAASGARHAPMRALVRLNFLRAAVALSALLGFAGAAILADLVSPDADPHPGVAFLLFLPLAALICWAWWALNWFLSLAGLFAVRDGEDAVGAISAAVSFCRERMGAVFAVSTWTGLAHLVAFGGATTLVSLPMGFAGVLPWRLVVFGVVLVTLIYFVVADWLYTVRLAGYVCIAEMPEAILASQPPAVPIVPPPPFEVTPVQTTIDRDEVILSDMPSRAET